MDVAADGTMVGRTDTYGAYLWNGSSWQQMINSTSMPIAVVNNITANNTGVYELRIAPSNTNVLYMTYEGFVFVSQNRGASWTKTSFVQIADTSNDGYRGNGEKMAVDPINAGVVYAGTPSTGLFVTSNGGASWANVSGVPASQQDANKNYPGLTGIAFDSSSGATAGKTNTIYVASYGNGVYRSTNAGVTWTFLSGGPTAVNHAVVVGGVYYATNDNGTNSSLWKFAGGTWTQLLQDSTGNIHAIAINPNNPAEIVLQAGSGSINVSYNAGSTWSGLNNNFSLSATDVPWLATTGTWLTIGNIAFNPQVANQLISSAGVGVWTTTIPASGFTSSSSIQLTSMSAGIEQLCPNELTVPTSGHPVLAGYDQGVFYIDNPKQYPSNHYPGNRIFSAAWSIDHASTDPNFVAALIDWDEFSNTEQSAYSTDGGVTWQHFASFPPDAGPNNQGGTIAVSTPTNIVWAPADSNQPYYTTDGGNTWKPVNLPGVSSWSGFDSAYYLQARTVTADRAQAGTFYLFYSGIGLYRTSDGGVTWTLQHSGSIASYDKYNAKLQAVPGKAGELFFTAGLLSGTQPVSFGQFYHSTDGGVTWNAVPNVLEVLAFGYGAPKVAGGLATIFIAGWVNNVYGIWQSDDDAATWTQIGTFPAGNLATPVTISGDPAVYGEVYVGLNGDGYAFFGP
jgi:hypothetical protein